MRLLIESLEFWIYNFALIIIALWITNCSKNNRYQQRFLPILALIYCLVIQHYCHEFYLLYKEYSKFILEILDIVLKFGNFVSPSTLHENIVFNWLILIGFFLIKLSYILVVKSIFIIRWLTSHNSSEFFLLPAYDKSTNNIVLMPEFYYFRLFFRILSVIAQVQLIVCILNIIFNLGWYAPILPALTLIMSLELSWYLGGNLSFINLQEIGTNEIQTNKESVIDYYALWLKYQELWPDRLLVAGNIQNSIDSSKDLQTILVDLDFRLNKGESLILKSNELSLLLPVLAKRIAKVLNESGKLLILVSREEQIQEFLETLQNHPDILGIDPIFHCAANLEQLRQNPSRAMVMIQTPDILLNTGAFNDDWFMGWFEQIRLMLIPNLEMIYTDLNILENLLHRIKFKAQEPIQQIFLGYDRQAIQSMLQRDLHVQLPEQRLIQLPPKQLFVLLWRNDAKIWFQQSLFTGFIGKYLGAEMPLTIPAWNFGVRNIKIYDCYDRPWLDQREELQNNLLGLQNEWHISSTTLGTAQEKIAINLIPLLQSPLEEGCIIIFDSLYNLSTALHNRLSQASKTLLVHVVTQPYLLRDYLAANITFFSKYPLLALSPRKSVSLTTLADTLWLQLNAGELDELTLLDELHRYDVSIECVKQGLFDLFNKAYQIDILIEGLLINRTEFRFIDDSQGGKFKEIKWYKLKNTPTISNRYSSTVYRFYDEANSILALMAEDRLYRYYLPGQIHVFDGRSYRINQIDTKNKIVNLIREEPSSEYYYRSVISVEINTCKLMREQSLSKTERHGWTLIRELCVSDFSIRTHGYYKAENELHFTSAIYEDLINLPQNFAYRHRRQGRCFKLSILPSVNSNLELPNSFTLCALIREILPSLLPEVHQSILVGGNYGNNFFRTPDLDKWYPRLTIPSDDNILSKIDVYILEDSEYDIGAIQCLYDSYEYIFEIIYDYLDWLLKDNSQVSNRNWTAFSINNHTNFLSFGLDTLPVEFELEKLMQLLEVLNLGCSPNCINAKRKNF